MAYDQFNPLAELGYLYGTAPTQMLPTGQQDPNAMINELLRSLPQETAPEMQQPKTWQKVLGSLSDALLQYSTVRGGGQPMPVGPYAARRFSSQQQQAQMAREAAFQNRETERRVRIGAFENQMRGEREARNIALKPTPTRAQIRSVTDPDTGEPALQEFIPQPGGGFSPGAILARGPEVVRFLSSPEGYFPASGKTGEVIGGPRQAPGGGTIYPPPPAGVVSNIAKGTATLEGIDEMQSAYSAIRQHISSKDQGLIGQYAGGLVGGSEYGGPLSPEYSKYYTRMNAALNNYVLAITGQQFSDAALTRYASQFPKPWDPEDVAAEKIASVKQRAVADMKAQLGVFPGAAGAAPKGTAPAEPTAEPLSFGQEILRKMREGGQ